MTSERVADLVDVVVRHAGINGPTTSQLVRRKIIRTIEQARELERLYRLFSRIAHQNDETLENQTANRIDYLRRVLGELP